MPVYTRKAVARVAAHPHADRGGEGRVLVTLGTGVYDLYPTHAAAFVRELLEEHRVGNLAPGEAAAELYADPSAALDPAAFVLAVAVAGGGERAG
eukprot:gene9401-11798_t